MITNIGEIKLFIVYQRKVGVGDWECQDGGPPVLAREGNGWSGWSMGKTSIFSENSLSTYYVPDPVCSWGSKEAAAFILCNKKAECPKEPAGARSFSRLALPGPSGWATKASIQLRGACCLGCCSGFKGYSCGTSWAGVPAPFPGT